jgi:hypothetical protein
VTLIFTCEKYVCIRSWRVYEIESWIIIFFEDILIYIIGLGLWCLMPLSTIFQIYIINRGRNVHEKIINRFFLNKKFKFSWQQKIFCSYKNFRKSFNLINKHIFLNKSCKKSIVLNKRLLNVVNILIALYWQ